MRRGEGLGVTGVLAAASTTTGTVAGGTEGKDAGREDGRRGPGVLPGCGDGRDRGA